jgi:hypothetical protein
MAFPVLSRLHDHTHTPHSVGLLWTSDQPDAKNSDNTQRSQETDIHTPHPPMGFEPAVPASERPQTHSLDRAATEKGA